MTPPKAFVDLFAGPGLEPHARSSPLDRAGNEITLDEI